MGMIHKDRLKKLPNETCKTPHKPIEKSEYFCFTGKDGQKYFELDSYTAVKIGKIQIKKASKRNLIGNLLCALQRFS